MNWLNKFFGRILKKTDEGENEKLENNTARGRLVDEDFLLDLEERLLKSDCGIELTEYLIDKLKQPLLSIEKAEKLITETCCDILLANNQQSTEVNLTKSSLRLILIVGVNGVGKTTTIGKLAYQYYNLGKKVLIAPCDTFRAAAENQLRVWAQRANADFFTVRENQKPDSILFEAIKKAERENYNVLIVDTAGRLQNRTELMEELSKLNRVIDKHSAGDTQIERFLVIDATTGQNGYNQAVLFDEVTKLTGIVLTKLDGTAKGGIIFSICHNLKIPVRYIGIGEKIDQIIPFQAENFIREMLKS